MGTNGWLWPLTRIQRGFMIHNEQTMRLEQTKQGRKNDLRDFNRVNPSQAIAMRTNKNNNNNNFTKLISSEA